MTGRLAFTAMFAADGAVVARATEGLPGLEVDRGFGIFATWTQAKEFARRLNAGLGLSTSESQHIVTDVVLAARRLVSECDSLIQESKQFRQQINGGPARLEFLLAELELGRTLCRVACTCPSLAREDLLCHARSALSNAISAMYRCQFSAVDLDELHSKAVLLQEALDQSGLEQ